MSVDIIVSNHTISYLNEVGRKRKLTNYTAQEDIDGESDFSPAFIVELSAQGKQLQQNNNVHIAKLPCFQTKQTQIP